MQVKNSNVINKVKQTIKRYDLIKEGDSVLVGLSGGADSVALCHILHTMGINIVAAHLNHNIRGEEAKRDEEFAKTFAKKLGVRFVSKSVNVRELAKNTGMSDEMAGREARYAFFDDVCKSCGLTKIATAHNRNDRAETILMNLMRGSTMSGLSGIPYKRDNIIRPILDLTRAEIESYCDSMGLLYVTDSTNAADDYTRNKIRHKLLPLIEGEFNPNFITTVSKNADIISDNADYLINSAETVYKKIVSDNSVDASLLLKEHTAIIRLVIRQMLTELLGNDDVSSEFIENTLELVRENATGKEINLPKGYRARIEYGRLVVDKPVTTAPYEYKIKLNEPLYIKELNFSIVVQNAPTRQNDGAMYFSGIDTDNMYIRNRRDGDSFYPNGMSGKKKLKDYFIDQKIPREERNMLPIFTSNGDIAAIIGHRRDRRFEFLGTGVKLIVLK